MLGNTFGLPHLIIILAIVLLLFGAPKLPGLARSISQSMKIFRTELKSDDKAVASPAATSPAEASPAATSQAEASKAAVETDRSTGFETASTPPKTER